MKPAMFIMVGALALSGVACDNNPAKGKTQAQVTEAAEPAPVATSGVTYTFNQANSKIEYTGAKVTGKHDGTIGSFDGKVQLVDNDPTKSSVTVDLDLRSITSDTEKLTTHLKSADFFDVEKYPKGSFKSTAIKTGGEGNATHTVSGNLELRGVTKQVTFPATIKVGDSVQVNAEFAINRKDFGINYAGMANDLIKDEVLIKLTLDAKKGSS